MNDRIKWVIGISIGILSIVLINNYHPKNNTTTYTPTTTQTSVTQTSSEPDINTMRYYFINGCIENASYSQCNCIWNKITEFESKQQIIIDAQSFANTGIYPANWRTITLSCI